MKRLALDIETTNFNKRFSPYDKEDFILTIAAFDGKKQYFWNIGHPEAPKDSIEDLIELLSNPDIEIEGQNKKFDILWLEVRLLEPEVLIPARIKCSIFDSMVGSTILNLTEDWEKNSLDTLRNKLTKIPPYKEDVNRDNLINEPFEKVKKYNINDSITEYAVCTEERKLFAKDKVAAKLMSFSMEIERILIDIEKEGILVDKVALYREATKLDRKLLDKQKVIDKYAKKKGWTDFPINVNSPKQITTLLYNHCEMPVLMVSKQTGKPSADKDAILALLYSGKIKEKDKQVLQDIQAFRKDAKLFNTYIAPTPEYLSYDGKIHCKYNLGKGYTVDPKHEYGTGTGRVSSSDPPMQTIPRQSSIKNIFIADKDEELIEADYSQLELRIVAFLSREPKMIDAFNKGWDIHTSTMCDVLNQDYEEISEILKDKNHKEYNYFKQKRIGNKPVNFGILYGIGVDKLRMTLLENEVDMLFNEVSAYRKRWLDTFPFVKKYISKMSLEAEKGFVANICGLKLMTPYAKEYAKDPSGYAAKASDQRRAVNFPIQSLAAYITLSAMLLFRKKGVPVRLLGQVYDSILMKHRLVGPNVLDRKELINVIKQVMTKDTVDFMKEYFGFRFDVPLEVDINISKKWGE